MNIIALASRLASASVITMLWLVSTPSPVVAQWTQGGSSLYYNGGNVGIDTTAPTRKLDVSGEIRTNSWFNVQGVQSVHQYALGPFYNFDDFHLTHTTDGFVTHSPYLTVRSNGNVGIGTTNPTYKLTVEGAIGTRDIIVTNAPWSDYVFRPGYSLRPLSEVKAFIQQHGHLPDIPSEAEVKEKGVSMAEMQAKLLAKIEELTLHMIQAEQQNRDLRERIARVEKGAVGEVKPAAHE